MKAEEVPENPLQSLLEKASWPPFTPSSLDIILYAYRGANFEVIEPYLPSGQAVGVIRVADKRVEISFHLVARPLDPFKREYVEDYIGVFERLASARRMIYNLVLPRHELVGDSIVGSYSIDIAKKRLGMVDLFRPEADNNTITYKIVIDASKIKDIYSDEMVFAVRIASIARTLAGLQPYLEKQVENCGKQGNEKYMVDPVLADIELQYPRRSRTKTDLGPIWGLLMGLPSLDADIGSEMKKCGYGFFTISDAVKITGYPKTTLWRILNKLCRIGFIEKLSPPCEGYRPRLSYEPLLAHILEVAAEMDSCIAYELLRTATNTSNREWIVSAWPISDCR